MLNHVGTKPLETNRLILRRHEITDADDIYDNWATDPGVCRFWSWEPHKSIDETRALLAGWIDEYKKPNNYHWIIVLKSMSKAVGYIYLSDIDDVSNSVSVHYALSRACWNQGIMTEACGCILAFAFDVLGTETVHSNHHIENPASGRTMQKCGMRYVKIAREGLSQKHISSGEYLSGDRCYYEIKSSDWKQQN